MFQFLFKYFNVWNNFFLFENLVENPQHSDFIKLRRMLISTHMQDLKDTTQDVHYENYRAQCISQISQHAMRDRSKSKRESVSSNDTISETDRLLLQKDEEVCFYFQFPKYSTYRLQNDQIKTIFKKKNTFLFQIRRMQDKLVQMQEKLKTNAIYEMNKKNDSVIDV